MPPSNPFTDVFDLFKEGFNAKHIFTVVIPLSIISAGITITYINAGEKPPQNVKEFISKFSDNISICDQATDPTIIKICGR